MTLLAFERRWLAAVFETILPSSADARLAIGAADVPMMRFVDDLWRVSSWRLRAAVRLALWVVALSPMVALGRARTFARLGPGERLACLRRLASSRVYLVRELPIVLKGIACLGYCGLPEVQKTIGIHGVDAEPPAWAR